MSPQPAAPAQQTKPTPEPESATLKLLRAISAKPEDQRSTPERQILRAARLERDRSDLMERIGKNRDYLRLMADNEELSEDQQAWVNTFYPEKEKGERRSEDDITATRKAREEARKLH